MKAFTLGRRSFLKATATAVPSLTLVSSGWASARKMTIDLSCGAIGVGADLDQAIELAARHGFESVTPDGGALLAAGRDGIKRYQDKIAERKLAWGTAGLPVEFRRDSDRFGSDLSKLPAHARALQQAGVSRVGTWIMPSHAELTYLKNMRRHADRLRQVARILEDHNLRLGLEYVGPRTSLVAARYPFVHTMAEMRDLFGEIGMKNVGFVLDSWHWYTAQESAEDLQTLKNDEIVSVDLNDAPEGIKVEDQMDLTRRLPCATGVIDVKTFLSALVDAGYDGPVRAEPFDSSLKSLSKDEAVGRTAAAMKKAFALIS
jgi:sugar phosphate isomerase/epimerase